ncbi:MAG TPA: O-antigen ligase family protein [Acidobacteriaceae bacterium]|nr:O-antigen ligase family protein [Acidobacteriaceae bacterium]
MLALHAKLEPEQTSPDVLDKLGKREGPGSERENIWSHASTWALLLLLLYFAVDGVSPFVNEPTATRAVATSSAGGLLADRLSKLLMFFACMAFAMRRFSAVRRLMMQMKLVTAFPVLALLLFPVSQLPTRTISSGTLLLGGVLLLYYIMSRYELEQVLELLLVLGTATISASIVFAMALPQYGLDQMGGHDSAWKGIFSAKNYLGNIALFFLTAAVSCRPKSPLLQSVRASQICFCLIAIAFSRAATAYVLTAVYLLYLSILKGLHRFRKRDYFVIFATLLAIVLASTAVIVIWPDFLFSLLGKDVTLTGRTGIWSAVLESIGKRPLLGYGYQAFWLGLEGESYRVILAVSWVLAQAQNGFLDVMLEMGAAGLVIVLLIFGFALRDGFKCLLHSRNDAQLRAVEWYLAIVVLTLMYNLDESFLFEPKHLGSMIFLLACIGLRQERLRLRWSR